MAMNILSAGMVVVLLLAASGMAGTAGTAHAEPLEGKVQVGALVPITGSASLHGQDIRATLELAESEINEHLTGLGAGWEFDIVVEDTATSPVIALERLSSIKAHGIDNVVGTYSSAELRNVMGYATSNNMMLIAYASTAPSLGVPGDKIFRFIPDATKQAPANARLFESIGVTHVIPVWRGDAWGDDLVKATKERFEAMGGTFLDGVRYNPEAVEFSTEMSLLSEIVRKASADVGRDRIGILLLTFAEGINIAHSAYPHEGLADLKWVASDTTLNVGGSGSDRISSEFFDSNMSITLFAPPDSPTYDKVSAYVIEKVGREPIVYSLTAYEAAWALALSLYAADSEDPEKVAAALPGVLEERRGIFGEIVLNEAGDMDANTYEVWHLKDNAWLHAGTYIPESDSITWTMQIMAADEREEAEAESAPESAIEPAPDGGGCLIATAAFGSELAPQVQMLREIRDGTLLQTGSGSSFMGAFAPIYYSFSPQVADLAREVPEVRATIRAAITPGMYALGIMSVADPESEASVIMLGTAAIMMVAGLYVGAPAGAALATVRIAGMARMRRRGEQ